MGAETKIAWCDSTFSPWRGCTKVSLGCAHCYAERQSKRNPKVLGTWGPDGTRVIASEAAWREPLTWDKKAREAGVRRRVFCGSMCDVFEDRPELIGPRVRLFHLISETRHLDWLLLTKRPENVRRFHGGNGVPRSWPENMPPNVWLGVSVENQEAADKRIPLLCQIPTRVRFLSCEPLLGAVDLTRLDNGGTEIYDALRATVSPRPGYSFRTSDTEPISWVICGGESGPKARPCELGWIRSLVRQCRAAGTPCFVKQLGLRASDPENGIAGRGLQVPEEAAPLISLRLRDRAGADPAEWPADLRVQEFPA